MFLSSTRPVHAAALRAVLQRPAAYRSERRSVRVLAAAATATVDVKELNTKFGEGGDAAGGLRTRCASACEVFKFLLVRYWWAGKVCVLVLGRRRPGSAAAENARLTA